MKRPKKKKNKFLYIIIIFLSIYITYKYLEKKHIEINNKEFVNLVINNSFKEEPIINKLISKKKNAIKLLNKSYEKTINFNEDIKPIIYLYNSHPTEEYAPSSALEYSINPTVIINNYILEDVFNKKGYKTIVEEKSVTDILNNNNWNYASSYKASRILLEDAKLQNPSLKYFIDIHRDSLSKEKTTVKIDNKEYAKMIFLLGVENKNYEENLEFIEKINNKINEKYQGLSKGIYKKGGVGVNGIYNQDFSNRTILIEIGGYENSIVEVLNTSLAFSECFIEVLNEENV